MTSQTVIHIDKQILHRARRFMSQQELQQFVADTLLEKVTQLEQTELELQMREGYCATRHERQELNEEWQVVDGEGWPA